MMVHIAGFPLICKVAGVVGWWDDTCRAKYFAGVKWWRNKMEQDGKWKDGRDEGTRWRNKMENENNWCHNVQVSRWFGTW